MDEPNKDSEFLNALQLLRKGGAVSELDKALQELVGQIKTTGKAGSLTVTLAIAPALRGGSNTLFVTDTIKVVPPKQDREETLMFATDDNRLSRRDPRQPDLPGMKPAAEVREFPREASGGTDGQ